MTSNVNRAIVNAEAAKSFGQCNNVPVLQWKRQLRLDFPLAAKAVLCNEDERPELFAYFVQGGSGQVLTMLMAMCTLVLQKAPHVQCIH